MARKIGLGVLGFVVLLLAVIALQPAAYHVERRTTVHAAPSYAHAIVNDFHGWKRFNPWDKIDPNQKGEFGGAASGRGATFSWSGNDEVGEGHMTIEESTPEAIRIKQEFIKPFPGFATIRFSFKPFAGGTEIIWAMDGTNDFTGKAVCLVMSLDEMIGTKFEEGLARLKASAEDDAKQAGVPAGKEGPAR